MTRVCHMPAKCVESITLPLDDIIGVTTMGTREFNDIRK